MTRTFRDLQVWQSAMSLAELTYSFTAAFPKHEIYGLSSQMRRAAVSIPSNITEGAPEPVGKRPASSSTSPRAQPEPVGKSPPVHPHRQGQYMGAPDPLLLAARFAYISEAQLLEAETLAINVARMLNGLAKSLRLTTPAPHTNN